MLRSWVKLTIASSGHDYDHSNGWAQAEAPLHVQKPLDTSDHGCACLDPKELVLESLGNARDIPTGRAGVHRFDDSRAKELCVGRYLFGRVLSDDLDAIEVKPMGEIPRAGEAAYRRQAIGRVSFPLY
jgi:hypothetical protein